MADIRHGSDEPTERRFPAQLPLLPRRAVIVYPNDDWLDTRRPVQIDADDGQRYYIKGDFDGIPVRAAEWISSRLAERVGISTPQVALIELDDGKIFFGSRRLADSDDHLKTSLLLNTPSISNSNSPPSFRLTQVLSAIYALDMFLFNDDRHLGNYLSHEDAGARRLNAFDFGKALFWGWPLVGFPLPPTNTRKCGKRLRGLHGFDAVVARSVIDQLESIPLSVIEGILNEMPADWIDPVLRHAFLEWWANSRGARAQALRAGLSDGALL